VKGTILHFVPVELVVLQPFGDENHSGSVREHQLGAISARQVYGGGERIGSHGVAHERSEAIGTLAKSTDLVATKTRTLPLGPIIAGS
jgi:hypothetical protein